jgi:hypothetical protein
LAQGQWSTFKQFQLLRLDHVRLSSQLTVCILLRPSQLLALVTGQFQVVSRPLRISLLLAVVAAAVVAAAAAES